MDNWMNLPRTTIEYRDGVNKFIDYAFSNSARAGKIRCPCDECGNMYWLNRSTVFDHLICNGFLRGYNEFISNDEDQSTAPVGTSNPEMHNYNNDETDAMLREGLGFFDESTRDVNCSDEEGGPDVETETYYRLANDASKELYPGCKSK
ncbi:hypothetical protein ACP70R_004167 [Stipagrostis hirtigluma subsp. patula]